MSFSQLFLPLFFAGVFGVKRKVYATEIEGEDDKMMNIFKMQPKLRKIDESIELFDFLLKKGEAEAIKAKDQDVIIVFGNTGSGKSTFINFLLGCEMIKEKDGSIVVSDTSTIKCVTDIGVGKHSCTAFPKCIVDQNRVFFDMPGLGDNRGVEAILANHIVLKKVIENAGSSKFVMVLEKGQINVQRGVEWDAAIKFLEETFRKALGTDKDSFCLLITKTDNNSEEEEKIKTNIVTHAKSSPGLLELSQFVTVYDPLSSIDRSRMSKTIDDLNVFSGRTIRISVGDNQIGQITNFGKGIFKNGWKRI